MKIISLVFILVLVSCGRKNRAVNYIGEKGNGCSVSKELGSTLIECDDGTSASIEDNEEGIIIKEVVRFCEGSNEVGLRLSNGSIMVFKQSIEYHKGKVTDVNGGLELLLPGTYSTTTGSDDCTFTLDNEGNIVEL